MAETVIKVENVSKLYKLGYVGSGTFRDDVKYYFDKLRGKKSEAELIAETNDREHKGTSEYVWALKDINFEVKRGEIWGIIGKNGAGKSTLLKILSKITSPTEGSVKYKGRIASLLEVGTGFHGELTGRENIYLNGAVLGMTKSEIKSKFDEIVDFAGVERYVDTPVKRYSSGMTVRLGFAVAAHLEPEILIVDEVLAVGDAEFQKKAIGKMQDISAGGGRTVLFVSHNMTAIKSLCNKALLLVNGKVVKHGDIDGVVNEYMKSVALKNKINFQETESIKSSNDFIELKSIELKSDSTIEGGFEINKPLEIKVSATNKSVNHPIHVNLFFTTSDGVVIFTACSHQQIISIGSFSASCRIPADILNDNIYGIDIMFVAKDKPLIYLRNVMNIEGLEPKRGLGWLEKFPGLIRPHIFTWELSV